MTKCPLGINLTTPKLDYYLTMYNTLKAYGGTPSGNGWDAEPEEKVHMLSVIDQAVNKTSIDRRKEKK